MVRKYKKKSNRASWTDGQIKLALDSIKNGQSIKSCAAEFGIPRATLHARLKNQKATRANGNFQANLCFV